MGGLLNGCAKPSSQNSHVGTSNQWVHGPCLLLEGEVFLNLFSISTASL